MLLRNVVFRKWQLLMPEKIEKRFLLKVKQISCFRHETRYYIKL
jgi:hypothetical protein